MASFIWIFKLEVKFFDIIFHNVYKCFYGLCCTYLHHVVDMIWGENGKVKNRRCQNFRARVNFYGKTCPNARWKKTVGDKWKVCLEKKNYFIFIIKLFSIASMNKAYIFWIEAFYFYSFFLIFFFQLDIFLLMFIIVSRE